MQSRPVDPAALKQALVLGSLAVGWWIAVLVAAFYLRDLTVQAVGVGVYLPDQLSELGLAPTWAPMIPGLVSSLAALAALRFGGEQTARPFRALTILSSVLLVADAFAILAILYYVSITPT